MHIRFTPEQAIRITSSAIQLMNNSAECIGTGGKAKIIISGDPDKCVQFLTDLAEVKHECQDCLDQIERYRVSLN